jgi:hypothetical protein
MQDEAIGANRTKTTHTAQQAQSTVSLEQRLARKLDVARRHRGTVRFFESRQWLLRSEKRRRWARTSLRWAEWRLARTVRQIVVLRRTLDRRAARRLSTLPPKAAICRVFRRHCREAVVVAWCESRLDTRARNGQYLGLFQMGSYERRLFGHGATAHAQSRSAHRYFLHSGRDWSPWGCKPWHWE